MSGNSKPDVQNTHSTSRFTFCVLRFTQPRLIALFLFLIALAPRLPGLDRFLISDENTNIFFAGSDVIAAFLRGDLRGTYWHFYPGVTMSWLDALGMGGQYLLDLLSGAKLPPFSEYIYGDILSLVIANRVPYAILTAAAVPAMYFLTRKLLPNRVALLGALFLAFDPFYLAHSRVAHGDAPVAVFMSLSALIFFIYAQQASNLFNSESSFTLLPTTYKHHITFYVLRNPYLIASAVFGSLAALTKAPGQFMALFVIGMSLLYAIRQIQYANKRQLPITSYQLPHTILTHWIVVIIIWGLISLAVFILLWPSMWVDPLGTFRQMWDETFVKVDEGHLVYFFGQPTLNPGPWFYPYVIPFRLTPIILIGSLLSLLLFVPKIKALIYSQSPLLQPFPTHTTHSGVFHLGQREEKLGGTTPHAPRPAALFDSSETHPTHSAHQTLSPHLLLWLFTISLLLFGNLSPKKQDRYLLPLFPFLNLLAAIGWLGLISIINYQLSIINKKTNLFITNCSLLIVLLLHSIPVITYYPYYLTYFNPLLGGPARAAETTLIGWGEGMEQVAAYLNTKPNAENLYVASTPSQTLLPYFAGTGENFYTNDIAFRADYVVLYLAQIQRLAPSPEIVRYFEAQQPEKIITIKDVTYAKIYPGPKLILFDIPPNATPINIGLGDIVRLAGYKIQNPKPALERGEGSKIQNPRLVLYWHVLAPLSTNYTISVRARAVGGRLLAQQDQWPVDGLLPTTQWRQGDYIADTHTLQISAADTSQIDHFEIVVYNADTGETLGPPITINNE